MPVLDNPKHELFAQGVAKGLAKSVAYVKAGYSEKGADAGGSRLSGHPMVAARIEELQRRAADKAMTRAAVSVESLTQMLIEDRALAHSEGQAGAAVSAVSTIAKLHGLLIERKEIKASIIEELPDDERARLIEAFREAIASRSASLIEGRVEESD